MKHFKPKRHLAFSLQGLWWLAVLICVRSAVADCTLTNLGIKPLPEMGLGTYLGFSGGLYPGSANQRPPAHEAAGIAIAASIQPLDAAGNVDTNTGKIVLLSLGMSNATMEWAVTGTNHFTAQATNDPSLNPAVCIVDGAISGQDATRWTNLLSPTNWSFVITQRLAAAGVTTNQVQVLWLKEALQKPSLYGAFPLHAQELQQQLGIILRHAKTFYPNLKLAYLAPRTRAYTDDAALANPEPFAFETGYAVKWVIEDQITGSTNLNWNSASGPVVAPWISWGAYTWVDGLAPRSDGLTWLCDDLIADYTHPSVNGVEKVARQLLSFFKTDPTTTPWFLKTNSPGGPACAPSASVSSGGAPLTVNFLSNPTWGAAPMRDAQWTFDDGESSTNLNPVKIFPTPGVYHVRHTITDTNGNTAQGMVTISATLAYPVWAANVFTASELNNALISGTIANPDDDDLKNLLEYAMARDPKSIDPVKWPVTTLTNGVISLIYPRLIPATDVTLRLQASTDLTNWVNTQPGSLANTGLIQTVTVRESVSTNGPRFFRLRAFQ
jgi:PKD repeat protein